MCTLRGVYVCVLPIQVFSIEVFIPGKQQLKIVERRYTEFEELHKNVILEITDLRM